MFDNAEHKGVSLAASADRLIGFSRSLLKGGLSHLHTSGGFFAPSFHQFRLSANPLVEWVQEAKACRSYPLTRSTNLHSLCLFSFSREFGGDLKEALL